VAITVITQADATIQVGFSVTGGDSYQDNTLKNELTQAYQRRMGR
jgi:F0F1-type ATP synthase delta subunit